LIALVVIAVVIRVNLRPISPDQARIEEGILFLRQKGVLAADIPVQMLIFDRLRYPCKSYQAAQDRLVQLVAKEEETHTQSLPGGIHRFSKLEFPGYQPEDIFFLKHPASFNQRHQLDDGLCYMNAPAMVQHYAISLNNHTAPMIDLVKLVKDHFEPKSLRKYIFDPSGEYSIDFLQSILQPGSTIRVIGNLCHYIPEMLKSYGPGLISGFDVYEDFQIPTKRHYYGNHSGQYVGLHSMALVGYRKATNGSEYFLLQNWWKSKQFVEVDLSYLYNSNPMIAFVDTPQTSIPSIFSHRTAFFHESRVDKPEGLFEENSLQDGIFS